MRFFASVSVGKSVGKTDKMGLNGYLLSVMK